jgi:CubicO group peptidase (beta-lactamase class C family)
MHSWPAVFIAILHAAPAPGAANAAIARCVAARAGGHDFSGVISIRRQQGTTVYTDGHSGEKPVLADTRFNLASVSKMFTAVAVAQLVEAKKVAFDDPIGRYVEGLTPAAAAVTVRQLLTHSSGLGNFFSPQNVAAITKARTVSELLPLVRGETPAFSPGARFQYSNSGFLLLGGVVERASGSSYDEYLAEHVFKPAGMSSTSLDPALSGSGEAAMRGNPAGGAYGTAGDLQRFFAALLSHRLTSAGMLVQLTSRQIESPPPKPGMPPLAYGLGFGVGTFEGHRWFGHNGGSPGVNAEAIAFPDDRAVMIVLANRDPPVATQVFRELRPLLFDEAALRACAGR